jgi:predicted amidohydrolase YtcJ
MRKPYADRPDSSGWLDFSEKEMEAMLRESLPSGDQLLVHAVGDRTNETFLSAMEATGGKEVWSKRRVRIEHGDGIMPDLVARAPELGVVVVENPTHFTLRELFVRRYGLVRADQMQPFRSLLEAGLPMAIGSDGPNNPYLNIMLASVYPGKPREAISREQAVTAYTLTAAYAEFAEKEKGSLEPGKLADLAVLAGYFCSAADGNAKDRVRPNHGWRKDCVRREGARRPVERSSLSLPLRKLYSGNHPPKVPHCLPEIRQARTEVVAG